MACTRKRDLSQAKDDSRGVPICANNERIARTLDNLPTTRGSAFSVNTDGNPQHFIQSPIYENIEYDHTGVNRASSTAGHGGTSNFQSERRFRSERMKLNDLTVNNDDGLVHNPPPTRDTSGTTPGNGDTSNFQLERRSKANDTRVHHSTASNHNDSPRILPPTRDASRLTASQGDNSESQSERRSPASRLRTHYSIVNDGAEVPQILSPPTGRISELFSRVLENAVLNESRSEMVFWNDRLREHGSADNNDADGGPRNRKLSKLEITSRVIFVLTLIFILICCVARFTEQKTTSSTSVTLVSLFLAIGCFALYVLLGFFAICTIPFRNEPVDFNF